jgi:pyruvate/2-oxoglutarate dehydrogenase complex dihydrolipoamide dehydrogenase (E3) component
MVDVMVIGGGPAGVTAALRARELGATVALVEREQMGGTCTNDGCAPTRVLAKAARLARDAEQFEEYGLLAERPVLDFGRLIRRTQERTYRLHEKKQLLGHLEEAGVDLYPTAGHARFVDPHTVALEDGRQVAADKFIICVGGHARRLEFPGSEHTLTQSDVWRLERLPASVAIIGAAATGCQLASIFAAFGARVTVLEVAGRILAAEDRLVSRAMAEAFWRRGITLRTGIQGIARLERTAAGMALGYQTAEGRETIEVEQVITAVGWVGNVESLQLDVAGVDVDRGYVKVDDYLQTSATHIYAAGDVTGRMMLVQSAGSEARIAAENALLDSRRPFEHRVVPHGGFTDPEYASVGLTDKAALARGGCASAVIPYADLDRAVIDGRTEGFCRLIVAAEDGAILGAHVVGEQAVEVVQIAAAGMAAGMRVEQLAELELAYPTYAAILGLAARLLVRDLALTELAPEWQSLRRRTPLAAEWEAADLGFDQLAG